MAQISGVAAFFIVILFVVIACTAGWIIYAHLRARRLGLPPPAFVSFNPFRASENYNGSAAASGGIAGWVNDKFRALKNRHNRSAGGAYEEPLSSNVRGRASNRGFGPLDPDEAWDARVGTEADAYGPGGYYEEQELGLQQSGARGRSISREPEPYIGGSQAGLDKRYNEEMGRKPQNPFDDSAEPSNLRGVSPRAIDTSKGYKSQPNDESPTERRSMFHENM